MRRLKTQAAKESLLRRVRKQRLNYITVLPSLITILNCVCGFAAIIFASKGLFAQACYAVLLAMIADMLDGRIARMSRTTSSFGGQLDSLCDIISFGAAPAFLMLEAVEYKMTGFTQLNPVLASFIQRFIWFVAAVYLSCAAIRLARFNVENEEDESSHMSFMGLPTPAAAGVIVSLILFYQEILEEIADHNTVIYIIFEDVIIYSLPFLTLGLAILMVSRIRYPHIINKYVKGKKPFAYLMTSLLALGLIIWLRQIALMLVFGGFAASSLVRWLFFRKKPLSPSIQQEAQEPSGGPDIPQQDSST